VRGGLRRGGSYANWGNRYKGQPDPPRRRSLEKFVKVR